MPEMVKDTRTQESKYKERKTQMRITYHAGERFLQRVFQFSSYSKRQVHAIFLLTKDLSNLEVKRSRVPLPSFPNYYGVFVENTLVTVIPKRINATL